MKSIPQNNNLLGLSTPIAVSSTSHSFTPYNQITSLRLRLLLGLRKNKHSSSHGLDNQSRQQTSVKLIPSKRCNKRIESIGSHSTELKIGLLETT